MLMNIQWRMQKKSPLIFILLISMLLAACGGKKTIIMEPQRPEYVAPVQPQVPVVPSFDEAQSLLDNDNAELAAQYFYAIATAPDNAVMKKSGTPYGQTGQGISQHQRAQAWEYYAKARLSQGEASHYLDALHALEQCCLLNPLADQSTTWQETWYAAISHIDDDTAMDMARAIYPDSSRPWPLRAQAGLLFAMKQISGDNIAPAALQSSIQLLRDIYSSASPRWRASLEEQLLAALASLESSTLSALRYTAHAGNIEQFPYNVIQLHYICDMLAGTASPRGGLSLSAAIVQLQQHAYFENSQILNTIHGGQAKSTSCIALALPMSGTYAPVGLKVAHGASAAQWQLSNKGVDVDLHIINTESPSWLNQINALPSQCTTIGGPLRMNKYAELKNSDITKQRAVFTFMAQLEQNGSSIPEEGSIAWRFFSSTQDQMAALLDLTTTLGISQYGILAPDEPYGSRMTAAFSKEVQKLNGSVQTATYPPNAPAQWNSIVSKFVGRRGEDKNPIATASFQATFLPDSWGNMEMLVPNLFYHGASKQVLLGTSIWTQGLMDGKNSTNNFGLAIFPNAWNPNSTSPSVLALNDFLLQSGQDKADTWAGLGYDFIRFATTLALPQDWTAASLNATLASQSHNLHFIDWSMAPITWTAQGIASQKLFLFTPTPDGYELIDKERFARQARVGR